MAMIPETPPSCWRMRPDSAAGVALVFSIMVIALPVQAAAETNAETDQSTIQVVGLADKDVLLPDQHAPQAVSAVSAAFITRQAPTLNAFQLVGLLPGANVSSSDPYGLSTSSSLTLRGLGQDEIGVLMEGAPQNDIGYYYAYPSQFSDTENLRQISLQQGAVGIDSPTVGASGGLLSLSLTDPGDKASGLVDLSLGSYAEKRAFVRLDTGAIGDTGLKAFVSYSYNRADNWRGAGYDTRSHVDAKLLDEWGDGNRASLSVSFNDADTSSYPSPTLAEWRQYGRGYDFDQAYTDGDTNYWKLYRSPFRNLYFTAPVHLRLSDRLVFDSTTYLQVGYGNSPYGTQLATTGNYQGTEALEPIALPGAEDGVATVLGNYTGRQFRAGDVAKLTLHSGAQTVTAGLWFDYGTDHDVESYGLLGSDGTPLNPWGNYSGDIRTADGQLLAYEDERTVTVTKAFFLADAIAVTPRLTADIGIKGVDVLHDGINYLPGPQSAVRFDSFVALPRAALDYWLDDRQHIFANITTNFRAPDEYTLYNSYDGGGLDGLGTTSLKNEYSVSEELGYRYIGARVSASLIGFHYHFSNRQLATVIDAGGALINSTINAGDQSAYGLDAEMVYRPTRRISLYASGEYLHARIDDDLAVDGDYLPTKGKQAVSAPTVQFGLGSIYDDGRLFGSAALKYVGRQYATFMNDESIAGYATLDLSIGVHLAGLIDGSRTDLRFNVINATDAHVLSGVEAVSPNAQDTIGRNGTLVAGSAPAYYIGSGRAVMATLSRTFSP